MLRLIVVSNIHGIQCKTLEWDENMIICSLGSYSDETLKLWDKIVIRTKF